MMGGVDGSEEETGTGPSAGQVGTEHLKAAARELIAAARSFLEVAEEVVEDGRAFEEAAGVMRGVVAQFGPGAPASGETPEPSGGSSGDSEASGDATVGTADGEAQNSSPDDGSGPSRRSSRVKRINVE